MYELGWSVGCGVVNVCDVFGDCLFVFVGDGVFGGVVNVEWYS